jgi:fructose-bisphosphate aldolase, class II
VLVIDRILEIHEKIPNTHIVMHGSSSVPQELLDIINKYGGKMRETYGVPVTAIQKGIQAGVAKINVDTDSRLAMTGAIRKYMSENPGDFDPRDYLKPARAAMQQVAEARMREFGQAGHASAVPIVPLEEMAKRYKDGVYGESAKPNIIK